MFARSNPQIHTILPHDKLLGQTQTKQFQELRIFRFFEIGNTALLATRKLGLLCSRKCPGKLILRTYDMMSTLQRKDLSVISGFHSPIEKECLKILLRGHNSIIVCPARSLDGMRIPSAWKAPIERGDMLLLSAFSNNNRRPTKQSTARRNSIVAALADKVFIPYAAQDSKTLEFARKLVDRGKTVLSLPSPENSPLFHLGAILINNVDDLI